MGNLFPKGAGIAVMVAKEKTDIDNLKKEV